MKRILISSFDLEIGGVERSLISMLNNFDYRNYMVDLMLYSHTGDFLTLLPNSPHLLEELKPYKTFRMPIGQVFKSGMPQIGMARLFARCRAALDRSPETGCKQMQYMWKYALPFLPQLEKKYDVAISYLWPHYFAANKVEAKTKIAWIHTDFSSVDTDIKMDLEVWKRFNYIIAVSEECKNAFLAKYKSLADKVRVVENLTSPELIRKMAAEEVNNPLVKDQRFKIITVARLSHAKGIDNAVKALRLLKDKGYNQLVWYVVGYGGDETMLRELISQNRLGDSFVLLGKKNNPYPYMSKADLYVQPSRYEGKAVTVAEAQILGKPVLITNYPTARSQVKDGVDGCITELSVQGIAEGIEKLYLEPELRNRLADNCNQEDYSNTSGLERLYRLFN